MTADSKMSTLTGALVLPFSPKRGFTAIHRHSKVGTAVVAVVVLTALTQVVSHFPGLGSDAPSWPDSLGALAYGLVYSLLVYLALVWISTALMSGRGGKRNYSLNAKVLGFWMAWLLPLSMIVRMALPDHLLYAIIMAFLFLWFLLLLAVALSVANYVPLRRTWLPAFCSLAVASLVVYGLTLGSAIVLWSLT